MRFFVSAFIAIMLACVCILPAAAHPLGNFTINHLAKVRVAAHRVSIRYVVDMAEIPTFQVMRERSIDGAQRAARLAQWGRDESNLVAAGLEVRAGARPLTLLAGIPKVSTRPGAGGLPTLYFVNEFRALLPTDGSGPTLTINDRVYAGRIGWKDIVIAPRREPTNELRSYPSALLGSPRSITTARVAFDLHGRIVSVDESGSAPAAPAGSTSQVRSNLLSDMLAKGASSPLLVLLTLLIAAGLGALHALEPGHGKTLLAVSLVGARATPRQALVLAAALTLAHTAGVLALGLVLLALAQWIVPETVYPWISLVSGAFVAVLGAFALSRYVKARRGAEHVHAGSAVHDHAEAHSRHTHHGHTHSHELPGNAPLSFRSVVLIAMSGNVAPCPAALVVLLTALTLHQVGYGLLVVIAFSVGLAAVLTGLGVAVVHGASWLSNRRGFERVTRYGPLVTAAVICIIGAVMLAKASATVLQAPVLPVMLLVLAAIAGYAFAPGHTHAHAHAPASISPLEKETT